MHLEKGPATFLSRLVAEKNWEVPIIRRGLHGPELWESCVRAFLSDPTVLPLDAPHKILVFTSHLMPMEEYHRHASQNIVDVKGRRVLDPAGHELIADIIDEFVTAVPVAVDDIDSIDAHAS